jgi:uncharacterized membrane protein (Fun14 family)
MLNGEQVSVVVAEAPQMGIVESLKNAMQPETIANKLGVDKNMLIDIGIFGAIGFILGFLLKKYSEYFIALILLIVGILVLQHFDYLALSLNTQKIHDMLGLHSVPVVGIGYGSLLSEWVKSNIAGTVSLVVGFLIGLKVA